MNLSSILIAKKKSPVSPGRLKTPAALSANPVRAVGPYLRAPPALQPNVVSADGMWRIENCVQNHSLLIEKVDMKSIVYIFNCIESTITVEGKVTAIIIDNCKKCVIVMDTVIGSVEVLNSHTIKTHVQKEGVVSNITVDNTDGCCMELSPLSLGVQVITSRATDMAVVFPRGNGEFASPETYSRSVQDGYLSRHALDDQILPQVGTQYLPM